MLPPDETGKLAIAVFPEQSGAGWPKYGIFESVEPRLNPCGSVPI